MIAARRTLWTLMLACGALPAQQLRWQVPVSGPSTTTFFWVGSFVDFDGDGYRDLLRLVSTPTTLYFYSLEIASGHDGSILWQQSHPFGVTAARACHAGDMDQDGVPDLVIVRGGSNLRSIEVHSIGRDVVLWSVPGGYQTEFGFCILGNLDVDGDGRPDVLASTYSSPSKARMRPVNVPTVYQSTSTHAMAG